MASAIYFIDQQSKTPLVFREYRGDVPTDAVETFAERVIVDGTVPSPCVMVDNVSYLTILHRDLFVVAVCLGSCVDAMSTVGFLHCVVNVMSDYFKLVDREHVLDNVSLVYELLDEMMDFGYPQSTDFGMLQEYITQEKQASAALAPAEMTTAISWRPSGIFYKKNELFLDIVEKIDFVANSHGETLKNQVLGQVFAAVYLSGMPTVKLGLNDSDRPSVRLAQTPRVNKSARYVALHDVKFHQCVDLESFERDRVITFVPPDGKVTLMTYRVLDPRPQFRVQTQVKTYEHSRILITCTATAVFRKRLTASFVHVEIPVPSDVSSPRFKSVNGHVEYVPEKGCIIWKMRQVSGGGTDYSMKAELSLPSVQNSAHETLETSTNFSRPIHVRFEIPYTAVSGLQVRYLTIRESDLNYRGLPWVKYLTKSGDEFAFRL